MIAPAIVTVNSPRYMGLSHHLRMNGDFGERIRGLRIAKGMSQYDLAKRLGIKQASVSNIENGRTRELRGPTLAGLLKVLDTNQDYVMTGRGDPGPAMVKV